MIAAAYPVRVDGTLDQWVLRVAAYAALMTDCYPPFQLDMGGMDPGSTLSLDATPEPCDIR